MRIGIVGNGVVGGAIGKVLSEAGHEVGFWDINLDRRTHALQPLLANVEAVFVCLPTPQTEGSLACDTSALDEFFRAVNLKQYSGLRFVIKSTVPVGYTRKVWESGFTNVVHSPEFLTARTAVQDVKFPRLNVVGLPFQNGPLPKKHWLINLYQKLNPRTSTALVGSNTSELLKLALNSFFASKVAYWNKIQQFAEKKNVDYDVLRKLVVHEGRVHHQHTQVPGPDGQYGFGGTCLPKDLASLIYQLESEDLVGSPRADYQTVLSAAYFGNQEDRKREIK